MLFMALCERRTGRVPWRTVFKFRRDGKEITLKILDRQAPCALDGEVVPCHANGLGERDDRGEEQRLPSREHHMLGPLCAARQECTQGESLSFGVPRAFWGVTPGAAEVAA